jgi:hypothetical protein
VLIVVGAAGALLGLLPVAGVAAVAVGVGMKVRLYIARRRMPAAA